MNAPHDHHVILVKTSFESLNKLHYKNSFLDRMEKKMSFRTEINHLLPVSSSQQGINYDTFDSQENRGDHNTVSTGEGQHEQESIPSVLTPEQTPNEPVSHEHARQRSQLSKLSSLLSSCRPLKYSAIVFGQWTEIGRCSLAVRILVVISVSFAGLVIGLNSVQSCEYHFPFTDHEQQNNVNVTISYKTTSDHWMILIVVIPSYLTMVHCVQHLSGRTQVLRLPQAFKLAKKTKRVNIILLSSIIVIAITMLVGRNCFFIVPKTCLDYDSVIRSIKGLHLAWHLFLSVMAWQAVIGCLVFDVVIKALTALVDQCLDRIITTQADSVDHYIQLHQGLCCNVDSTFAAFKKWFLVNTFAYLVLMFYIVLDRVFYFPLFAINDESLYRSCYFSFSKDSYLVRPGPMGKYLYLFCVSICIVYL